MGRIITIFLLIVAIIAIYFWLAGGAWARIVATVPAFSNPLGRFFEAQKGKEVAYNAKSLAPALPSLNTYTNRESISSTHSASAATDSASLERAKEFGQPSPSNGTVTFESYHGYASGNLDATAQSEYLIIRANAANTSPVTITGWSLESAVSSQGMRIGGGSATYRMGSVTQQNAITLAPGEEAILVSGNSPIGTSFRTNSCSGYLAQFQSFAPALNNSCPLPSIEMQNTLDNQKAYGAACIDFVAGLPSCSYYLGAYPSGISDACHSFVSNALTYNGCVDRHQWDPGFASGSWRIYLGSSVTLWNPLHDVIRLLDASGRTVDVLSY